jgi:hypothetical protein
MALALLLTLAVGAVAQESLQPDNEPPVAQCQDATLRAEDFDCCAWVNVDDINDGSYDPEGLIDDIRIVAVNGSPVSPGFETDLCGIGTYEVTLEIEDLEGLTDQCTATVTVWNDPPYANCRSYMDHADASGCISVNLWDVDDGSYDPEGYIGIMRLVAVDGTPVPPGDYVDVCGVGPHTVTLEIIDECGQSDSCDADVTVQNDPPYIDCYETYTYEYPDAGGCVTVYMSDLIANAGDPDGDPADPCIVAVDGSPVPCVTSLEVCGAGPHVVKIVITDDVGARDSCECTVTIQDLPPIAYCSDVDFYPEYECCFTVYADDIDNGSQDPEGHPVDLCIIELDGEPVACEDQVEVCGEGPHPVWLRVTDVGGQTDSCEATVWLYFDPIEASCREFSEPGDYDCCRDVDVIDLYGGDTYGLDSLFIIAVDDVSLEPTDITEVCGSGMHQVRLLTVDVCGNRDSCEADVLIQNEPPDAYARSFSEDGGEDCCLTVNVYDIDDGSGDYDGNVDSLYISEVDGEPNTSEYVEICGAGDHTVTLRITDTCGESDEDQTTVTIINEPPVAMCQPYSDVADENCCIMVNAMDIDDGSYDPDGPGDIDVFAITELDGVPVDSLTDVEVCGEGEHDIELTVTDWCGESSSCMTTVTVENDPPVAQCKYFWDEADEDCCIMVAVEDIDDGSFDPQGPDHIDRICIVAVDGVGMCCAEQVEVCGAEVSHTVSLEIRDVCGAADTCDATVDVIDVTPPEIDVSLDRYVIWPPNHKMVEINASLEVSDNCDDNPVVELVSITSSEPPDSLGDGHHLPDIEGADFGTADSTFSVRAERDGTRFGRTYTVVFSATDFSGNMATGEVHILVPHNQPGMAITSAGFTEDGAGFVRKTDEFVLIIPSANGVYGMDEEGNSVVIESHFDATRLSIDDTRVGNTTGDLVPVGSSLVDYNGDGLMDFAVSYSVPACKDLADKVQPFRLGETLITEDINPVGLHYISATGINYLVDDIFALGAPVTLGSGTGAGIDDTAEDWGINPEVTVLLPISPNPFNRSANILFNLATDAHVSLKMYDARGTLVRSLQNGVLPAGLHHLVWDGRDGTGRAAAPGVYFARFETQDLKASEKVMLLK